MRGDGSMKPDEINQFCFSDENRPRWFKSTEAFRAAEKINHPVSRPSSGNL